MAEKLSICGYRCDLCTVYKDKLEKVGKEKVKAGFKKYFNYEFTDETLTPCQGCPEGGDDNCTVKPCAKEKGVANCGLCDEFPCGKVKEKMDVIDKYFDDISALPDEDKALFVEPYQSEERLRNIKRRKGK